MHIPTMIFAAVLLIGSINEQACQEEGENDSECVFGCEGECGACEDECQEAYDVCLDSCFNCGGECEKELDECEGDC
jgi:hypothetical protein